MEFASYELNKYAAMIGINIDVDLYVDLSPFDTSKFFRFEPKYDDAFEINVINGKGTIKGTNERAVLIGVYHYLKCQGCRFLKPGKDGEYIPRRETPMDVKETWYAKVRHRGSTNMCGWNAFTCFDSTIDFLDWMPKNAMNTYFIELEDYYESINPLIVGKENKYSKHIPLSRDAYNKAHKHILEEMQKRHILYHNAGHGWTIRMMEGIDKISFEENDDKCLNSEILALTSGKREKFNNKPILTNLCYSQEKGRKDLAKLVYEYSVNHPETDFIHFWLADYFGNFCQCEECKKKRPSDWYIMILNEIDKLFTEKGSDKKIVFLIYFELAYPPLFERINNPDRFVMMFAPYGRNFLESYRDSTPADYEPKLNNDFDYKFMDMNLYLKQLEEWQKIFKGDSFSFDYSFYDNSYFTNICQVNHSKAVYLDAVDIKKYGLNGKIECGNMRMQTPTGFAIYSNFIEMFYGNTDYDKLYKDYFRDLYGEGQKISEFLETTAELIPHNFIMGKKTSLDAKEKEALAQAILLTDKFAEELQDYVPDDSFHRKHCYYFGEFLNVLKAFLIKTQAKANNESENIIAKLNNDLADAIYKAEYVMPDYISAATMKPRVCI